MEDVRKDPYSLPASFQWSDLNLDNDEEVKELYTLLHENYVEDGDAARSRARPSQRLGGAWARRLRLRKARSAALGSPTRPGAEARSLVALGARRRRAPADSGHQRRRQHVPLRLLARLPALGALAARLQARVARGRARDPGEE